MSRRRFIAAAGGVSALALTGAARRPNLARTQTPGDNPRPFSDVQLDLDPASPVVATLSYDDGGVLYLYGTKDDSGNITSITSATGQNVGGDPSVVTQFQLDPTGRPLTISGADGSSLALVYDDTAGQVTATFTDPTGQQSTLGPIDLPPAPAEATYDAVAHFMQASVLCNQITTFCPNGSILDADSISVTWASPNGAPITIAKQGPGLFQYCVPIDAFIGPYADNLRKTYDTWQKVANVVTTAYSFATVGGSGVAQTVASYLQKAAWPLAFGGTAVNFTTNWSLRYLVFFTAFKAGLASAKGQVTVNISGAPVVLLTFKTLSDGTPLPAFAGGMITVTHSGKVEQLPVASGNTIPAEADLRLFEDYTVEGEAYCADTVPVRGNDGFSKDIPTQNGKFSVTIPGGGLAVRDHIALGPEGADVAFCRDFTGLGPSDPKSLTGTYLGACFSNLSGNANPADKKYFTRSIDIGQPQNGFGGGNLPFLDVVAGMDSGREIHIHMDSVSAGTHSLQLLAYYETPEDPSGKAWYGSGTAIIGPNRVGQTKFMVKNVAMSPGDGEMNTFGTFTIDIEGVLG